MFIDETQNTTIKICTQAEYEEMIADNKITAGDLYCIAGTVGGVKMAVDTGFYTYYDKYDFEEDGVRIKDLKELKIIEKALFESFKQHCPKEAENWDALLRINNNDYEITLRQILEAKKGV